MRRAALGILLGLGGLPAAAQTRLDKPILGTPTIIPAGPTWMTVASDYPTHMILKWTQVPNAVRYRVYRWGADARRLRKDQLAADLASATEPGYATIDDDLTISYTAWPLTTPAWYEVQAVFLDAAGNQTYSSPNPSASAVSVPFLAPANIRWSVAPAADKPFLRVTLTWDAVPAAAGYRFTGTSVEANGGKYILPSTRLGPTLLAAIDGSRAWSYPPGGNLIRAAITRNGTYTFCLSTIYPDEIRDESVKNCITVEL